MKTSILTEYFSADSASKYSVDKCIDVLLENLPVGEQLHKDVLSYKKYRSKNMALEALHQLPTQLKRSLCRCKLNLRDRLTEIAWNAQMAHEGKRVV